MTADRTQQVDFNGKTYSVHWYGDRALVSVRVKTATGHTWRALGGHGRARRDSVANKVLSAAKAQE